MDKLSHSYKYDLLILCIFYLSLSPTDLRVIDVYHVFAELTNEKTKTKTNE